jgi:hypothetical protein
MKCDSFVLFCFVLFVCWCVYLFICLIGFILVFCCSKVKVNVSEICERSASYSGEDSGGIPRSSRTECCEFNAQTCCIRMPCICTSSCVVLLCFQSEQFESHLVLD